MDSVSPRKCSGCKNGAAFPHVLRTAFQPIYDLRDGSVFAYEALVRGEHGQGAAEVLGWVDDENLYAFDQACRVEAIRQAVAAGLLDTKARLSINFMPNAVYSPMACIQLTLKTAREVGLAEDRLIFELTENERVDTAHVREIVAAYRSLGFATAIDDFGAGYAGLNLLANLQTDLVKIDMELVRGIDSSEPRRQIVYAIVRLCAEMGRQIIAEGIETPGELEALQAMGVHLVQGYYLARPALGSLAPALSMQPARLAV
ncbi:EAL domain-containing protein [Aurantiacibacter suaedae]|uniref:EAL domain-containing protein n=1 Tax=Aurantiacibacter suaedae TaxID=2545755 RepID=UPI0010F8C76D|nr:EAL domain-containing protein [Aurantiacibacter suaedae]